VRRLAALPQLNASNWTPYLLRNGLSARLKVRIEGLALAAFSAFTTSRKTRSPPRSNAYVMRD
jgi:hypothetical protein